MSLTKVPAGDEGGGDLEASRIGMLLYSCIWGDDQPPESRPTHLVRSARCGVENPLVRKAQTPENGTERTLHSLPALGVHLEPQETQRYDVIHAPNTDSAEAQQAYQPHLNVGLVPAGRQGSCHRAQADMDQQATALCAEMLLCANALSLKNIPSVPLHSMVLRSALPASKQVVRAADHVCCERLCSKQGNEGDRMHRSQISQSLVKSGF